jgi:4-amino-4-deoxy-L-arabinose transferase-like glycosyltransferase
MARDRFLHTWDERFHALVAKNMIEHPLRPVLYADPVLPYDFRHWTANHVWLHKPPFALWLMALSMATFGVNEIALRLPNLLHSTLAVALTFAIGRRVVGERAALLAASLQATNGYLLELAGGRTASDHVESLVVTLVTAGAFLSVEDARRPRWILAAAIGAVTGLTYLTKSFVALLIPAIWIAAVFRVTTLRSQAARLAFILFIAMAIALPWELYVHAAFPQEAAWEEGYNWRHFFEALEGHHHPPLYYFQRMARAFGELVYIPVVWFLARVARGRFREGWPILVWFAVPYFAFSFAATKMPGYVAAAAPAVFLMTAAFIEEISEQLPRFAHRPALRAAAISLVVLLLALPLRTGLERMKLLGYPRDRAWAQQFRELRPRLQGHRSVLFGVEHPIEAMFYTSATAYSQLPSEEDLRLLRARGLEPMVLKPDS